MGRRNICCDGTFIAQKNTDCYKCDICGREITYMEMANSPKRPHQYIFDIMVGCKVGQSIDVIHNQRRGH